MTTVWPSILLFALAAVRAQTIDFNDGGDTALKRFNPLSALNVSPKISFPDDEFGGKAYRFESPAPPVADAGPARMFSYFTTIYSDFYAAVDIVAWDNELNQAFGILFRAENIGLGQTTGYVLNYDPQQASGGRGQIQINLVEGESDRGTIGAANLSLQPGHRYRFVLTAAGPELTSRVYDWNDFTAPIATFKANDATYTTGVVGLFNFYRGKAVADKNAGHADTTFDNFVVSATAPTTVPFPGTPHPIMGIPQVVNRTPPAYANFSIRDIRFTALTEKSVPLRSALVVLGPDLIFPAGETSDFPPKMFPDFSEVTLARGPLGFNDVYDAQIILEDTAGRKSTNSWTFDTLTEEFLSSPGVKVIEAEDYNFDGGKFIDNPPPSGAVADVIVNGNGKGYFDLVGVPGVDYLDRSDRLGSGAVAEYRSNDFVGTQAGSSETGSDAEPDPAVNDTIRKKYSALALPEYQVRRTEGTEWLNYTQTFEPGPYRVFLRVACSAPQIVNFEKVTSDPTKSDQTTSLLGSFNVPSTAMLINYRYVPLVDPSGNRIAVSLSGMETVRLAMAPPPQNATQNTIVLNYLLFVPYNESGLAQLQAAESVTGPYLPESSAVREGNIFRVRLTGERRFYRLRYAGGAFFTAARLTGQELELRWNAVPPNP